MKIRMRLVILPGNCSIRISGMNWISGDRSGRMTGRPGGRCCLITSERDSDKVESKRSQIKDSPENVSLSPTCYFYLSNEFFQQSAESLSFDHFCAHTFKVLCVHLAIDKFHSFGSE